MTDIAARVWNHRWKIDPIIRSLIDTDFYKLLMCQSVHRSRPDVRVRFSLINRTREVRLADLVDEGELREQLDHVRTLSLGRGESTWLRGNSFYGKRQIFSAEFMEWLEALRLPPYDLTVRGGQYELTFEGPWCEVMLWEIPALAILMELRGRAVLGTMGRFELEVLYARAKGPGLGEGAGAARSRRAAPGRFRHAPAALLPVAGLVRAGDAGGAGRGLHRHLELPDRAAPGSGGDRHQRARAAHGLRRPGPRTTRRSPPPPTTCSPTGTRSTRATCASSCPTPTARPDSSRARPTGSPAGRASASTRAIRRRAPRWRSAGGASAARTRERSWSSSLTGSTSRRSASFHARFSGRVRVSFGWGTLLTNDFRGLAEGDALAPFSLVCKAVAAGRAADGQALGQPAQGDGPRGRGGALPRGLRGRRAGGAGGRGLRPGSDAALRRGDPRRRWGAALGGGAGGRSGLPKRSCCARTCLCRNAA